MPENAHTPPRLHLIYARASNGVIGKDNGLPWHLPEDLAHFKRTTLGCPVIMGRKTWDSLPPQFRPLPGRSNIVISRDGEWSAEGAKHATSVQGAMALCEPGSDAWVIGGAQIYSLALPLASSVVVTEIARPYEGDAFAPELGPEWVETRREPHSALNGLLFAFVTYTRAA
ncbi:dihydrofolate reductase [Hydrogenophaga crassostreae]|uniref:Dihydrofolate reductase n=1 Tax=Hydrogenophaga crassostreae TaxID=1763535 RepID=A0A162P1E4_9BURK|nr:dihydrofolate reductase [Hydrogenophaga crassostreae]AOW13005.1 dihydrofolate reductase [Hydrogenophaga crassostreae]OAD40187.1 dihydrofolate reductase [Hydrogenophaga crassostreae]